MESTGGYDIAIVGAGPAGATLARLIGSRYKTLVLDRRSGAAGDAVDSVDAVISAEKCCGGLIAPDAQKALAAMGLGLPRRVLVGPQLFAVRAIDLPSGLQGFYPRHYLNTDRAALDGWLISLIPPAVDIRRGHGLRGLRKAADEFALQISDGRQMYSIEPTVPRS